jgi:(2Fe-2S) ferredoxin
MTGPSKPRTRLVLCMGQYCNRSAQAAPLYERLREVLGDPVPAYRATGPVLWETATCLDMCGAGPNLIIYPDEIVHNALDLDTLNRILDEYLP